MKHGDDLRMRRLLKELPDLPVEMVAHFYRLDRLIDDAKEELAALEQRRMEIERKAVKELEKK